MSRSQRRLAAEEDWLHKQALSRVLHQHQMSQRFDGSKSGRFGQGRPGSPGSFWRRLGLWVLLKSCSWNAWWRTKEKREQRGEKVAAPRPQRQSRDGAIQNLLGDFVSDTILSSGIDVLFADLRRNEDKVMGPMFPRLHVNDADKEGPKAHPRNKMALYEQLSIPSQRFNPGMLPLNAKA
ncbi:hypothetical protein C1H46_043890 [Malus baccata]|uniref:Uncharacterized protein n=1 Tax=Malus baccata TaxID=106549 RepID=A0A540K8N0_MALBA|nr:hypothetical protein C1H46_043890 [Malus baccata]